MKVPITPERIAITTHFVRYSSDFLYSESRVIFTISYNLIGDSVLLRINSSFAISHNVQEFPKLRSLFLRSEAKAGTRCCALCQPREGWGQTTRDTQTTLDILLYDTYTFRNRDASSSVRKTTTDRNHS